MRQAHESINAQLISSVRRCVKTNVVLDSLSKGKQEKLTAIRKQQIAVLDVISDPELYDILTDIPDDVLWLLWTVNDDFANQLSLMYEAAKGLL